MNEETIIINRTIKPIDIWNFLWIQARVTSRACLSLLILFFYGYIANLESYTIPNWLIWILKIVSIIWVSEPIIEWIKEIRK